MNWVLDADISRFFDTISHEWLVGFVEHRIAPRALRHDGDTRIVRLIQKWLKVGVLEDGKRIESEEGTPRRGGARLRHDASRRSAPSARRAVISPLLANIYLHYVYDLWADQWRKRQARGDVIFVRYADDTVVGFEHRSVVHCTRGVTPSASSST